MDESKKTRTKITINKYVVTVVILCSRTGGQEQAKELLVRPKTTSKSVTGSSMGKGINESGASTDSSSFSFDTVIAATNNFSSTNKLGEGGFGSVYKVTFSSNMYLN